MPELFRKITNLSQAGYGVNLLEQTPPTNVRGQGTGDVGIVMAVPWGPYEIQEMTSLADLYALFSPPAFGVSNDYPSLKALLNKKFPAKIMVKRVSVTGAITAGATFTSTGPVDSVVASARYAGVNGNKVAVEWVDGTSAGTQATAIVTVGTGYRKVHKDVVTGTVVTDPGDPFVVFTAAPGIAARPTTVAATLLTGGDDGTAVAADWTGAPATFEGVRAFRDTNSRVSVGFGAEVPAAFIDVFNTALMEVAEEAIFHPMISTPAGQTRAQQETYAGNYRAADGRGSNSWPLVKTPNFYDPNVGEITVDGNAFNAAVYANSLPEDAPGGGPSLPWLKGITGIETPISQGDYDSLLAAGVNGFFRTNDGYILQGGVSTSLTPGLELASRRRMADYIGLSLAAYHQKFVGKLLDIRLSDSSLGAVTAPQVKGHQVFLQDLKDAGRISDYKVDPFYGSQTDIDAGTFIILTEIKLFSNQQKIVLLTNIGSTVAITSEA